MLPRKSTSKEKNTEKFPGKKVEPDRESVWSTRIVEAVWVLISAIGVTLVGGGTCVILYLLFPSPLMTFPAILVGTTAGVATALYIAAKREQRQDRELQLGIETLKEEEKAFFESMKKEVSSLLKEEARFGKQGH